MKLLPSVTLEKFVRGYRHERNHARDLKLNDRHRLWGADCMVSDIDFLAVEYEGCRPVAIVEYKRGFDRDYSKDTASLKAIRWLGDHAGLPVFFVIYSEDFSKWRVIPDNPYALQYLEVYAEMTEFEYVHFLYALRGWDLSKGVFEAGVKTLRGRLETDSLSKS